MVRLVILSWLLVLAGCAPAPQRLMPVTDTVPDTQELQRLDDGIHHPAIVSLLQQAEQARQLRQWQRVNTYLDQARQIQPRNPAIFYRQAWVRLQQNDAVLAEQLCQRGLVFAEDAGLKRLLYRLQADALDVQGRTAEALAVRRMASGTELRQ